MAKPHLPEIDCPEAGFSLLELIISLVFIIMISGAMAVLSKFVSFAMTQGEAKAIIVNSARNGLDALTLETRNVLVLFNTAPNTPLGVNFDLDDPFSGKPAVRDAFLCYFDRNQSARLVDLDGDGVIDNLGLDDQNGDGQPDVIGIGLVPQEFLGNGAQDFIDTDRNKIPDDLNGDGVIDDADKLWRLVIVNFDNIGQVNDVQRWRNGRTVASNIYLIKTNPTGKLVASNIKTIQYINNGSDCRPFDTNNDGQLSETEIGNSESADGIIDTPNEVKRIGAIKLTLNLAIGYDYGRRVSFATITSIIKPRAFEVLHNNDITAIPDLITPNNIN